MATINFGGVNSSGNLIYGLASGLNSKALIDAAVGAKKIPINDLIVRQTEASAKVVALKQLKGVLNAIKNVAKSLKNPTGFRVDDQNAFQFKKSSVTGNPTGFDSAKDLLSVVVDPGAAEATYTIQITQLAQVEVETIEGFGTLTGDLTDGGTPEVVAGTFQINGIDVTIASGATLADIKTAINAKSSETGVTANIITITPESAEGADDGEYQLQLVGNETGDANSITFTNFTTVFPGSGGVTVTETQPALDASIEFNGSTIERSTNTIDDIVDNITFDLLNAEVGTDLTVTITKDTSVPSTQITNLVAGLNNLSIFESKNNARDSNGNPLDSAILLGNPTLRALMSQIQSEITREVSGVGGSLNSLTDIGFELDLFEGEEIDGDPNTPLTALLTDKGLLNGKLTNSYNDTREVFELQFSATGANDILAISSAANTVSLTEFTISIDVNQAAGQRVTITPSGGSAFYADFVPNDPNDLTAGGTIKGIAGTAAEGLVLVYVGDGTDGPISATLSNGIANRIYNVLEDYSKALGIIDDQIALLEDEQDDLQKEIDDLNVRVEVFRQKLTDEYAALDVQINAANSALGFLSALADVQNRR